MDKRDNAVIVRLTKSEKQILKKKSKDCCMKMEPFIRKLIIGAEIRARPPTEYIRLVHEINAIGNNINQIAHIANTERRISQREIQTTKRYQAELIRLVRGLR